MADRKITKVEALQYVLDNATLPTDVKEKLEGMIVTLQKKSTSNKPTAKQEENEVLKGVILSVLTDEGATVSEIQTKDERISPTIGISNQKVSSLLRQLVAEGKVKKANEGKKSLFLLA